jgi:hypothetical protein
MRGLHLLVALAALPVLLGTALAQDVSLSQRVNRLEAQLDGHFILTTADGRSYRVYQKLDVGTEPSDGNILCIFDDCYVMITPSWDPGPAAESDGKLAGARDSLRQLWAAYDAEERGRPLPSGVTSWAAAREATKACLGDPSRC